MDQERKIVILGRYGMLGNYLYNYLRIKNDNVIGLSRKDFDAEKLSSSEIECILFKCGNNLTIINAIGYIKPSKVSDVSYIKINSIFPHILETICLNNGWKLIHISTDCVFKFKGNYTEIDDYDADDIYGKSKAAGELHHSTTIRTSIIGEEQFHKYSLIEWIKSNRGKTVNGFDNHIWNGMTCLQLSKIIYSIIDNNLYWEGIRNIFSPNSITKYDLILVVNEVYNLDLTINKISTSESCNKTLSSIYESESDIFSKIPEIKDQIQEMRYYSDWFD